MKNLSYYSSGKFLISGEYLVLKGAKALAIPLKFGQTIQITSDSNPDFILHWKAFAQNQVWFDAEFDISNFEIIETNDLVKAKTLSIILQNANILNPKILQGSKGITVETHVDFNLNWGLGSSSTLIANVAQWFQTDPMLLHFKTSSGSGYDVACATAESPIFYTLQSQRPLIQKVGFVPGFSQNLYFVYLGKKQQSQQSIIDFSTRLNGRETEIYRISEISGELTSTQDLEEFEFFLNEHEQIMSAVLGLPTVKETTFAGFPGSVKSLGAWGGDFVLVTWRNSYKDLKKYLETKYLETAFPYDEIILKLNT
ncbi:MAG: hypothetical protein K9H16_06835 [Bacteroidales bacterium]|nr:hypothetical protein [Bacteroidales bacterium]